MKKFMIAALLVVVLMFGVLSACAVTEIPGLTWESSTEKEFATGFNIDYYGGGYALIEVVDDCKYLVVPENMQVPDGLDEGIKVLQQPLDRIYLQATSAMALFDQLDGLDNIRLVGTRQSGWYVDNAIKAMEEGRILFSGSYSEPDYELMINEGCDLAIESTMILHSPKVMEMIEMLGIPVFVEHASYEDHPLGRTEWIKVYGAMLGKKEKADAFFATQSDIIDQFADIENTGKTVAFFYVTSDGRINVRASSDYVPKMIKIAGGKYIFEEISEPGSKRSSVSLTMEEFYNAAIDADYIVYNATIDDPIYSIEELIAKDALFADFKAVQSGDVWCTGKALFQATDITGSMIVDFHNMLTGQDDMTFLYKLP
jgi:iron complex transport system substrate-binding protein